MENISISSQKILNKLKLSYQLPQVIEEIVKQEIIEHWFTYLNLTISEQELQQNADRIRIAQKLYESKDTIAWLKKYYLTVEDFEEIIKYQLKTQKLAQHLFSEKIEPFFYDHQHEYTAAVIYEVILDDQDLAIELFYELSEDEISFAEIVHQYSKNPQLSHGDGYKGVLTRAQLKPEISAPVFAAQPPQILQPIITSEGVHLIKVEKIIKPSLTEQVRFQIMQQLFKEWLKQKLVEITLNCNLDDKGSYSISDNI